MDPVAGSRRRWLAAAGIFLLGACGGSSVAPAAGTPARPALHPVRGLLGARIALKVDAMGTPLPGAYGPYQPFVFPVAVAVGPLDIFIADAGVGRIFRYDRALDALFVMPGRAHHGTRLQAGSDGSVHVLDPPGAEISRYGRAGNVLPALLPAVPTSSYRDFAVDPVTGRGFAIDVANLRIDRIEPHGRLAVPEIERHQGTALAIDRGSLFLADAGCRCIVEWRDGRVLRELAPGELSQPRALAADRGRLYALDAFDRSICIVFAGGVLRMRPEELGLVAPEAIAAAEGLLYVADGAGHAIAVFRPAGGQP